MAKMTLFGVERYLNSLNESLFDSMTVPTGCTKDVFINSLMLNAGEFAVLYGDPEFMKGSVEQWSLKNNSAFTRIFSVWSETYDPLHNYDRTEEISEAETTSGKTNGSRSGSDSNQTETHSGVTSSSTQKNDVSAYDTSGYSPKDRAQGNVNEVSSAGGSSSGGSSETSEENRSDMKAANRTAHMYGNIGVTTSQQMLKDEIAIRSGANPYDIMIDSFVLELLIPVYD